MRWGKYLRIKFKTAGRGWEEGDCLNLIMRFYEAELGISLGESPSYDESWVTRGDDLILSNLEGFGFVRTDVPAVGDVIVFTVAGVQQHLGVVIDTVTGSFLHCTSGAGTTMANYLIDPQYQRRVYGFYRYKG